MTEREAKDWADYLDTCRDADKNDYMRPLPPPQPHVVFFSRSQSNFMLGVLVAMSSDTAALRQKLFSDQDRNEMHCLMKRLRSADWEHYKGKDE